MASDPDEEGLPAAPGGEDELTALCFGTDDRPTCCCCLPPGPDPAWCAARELLHLLVFERLIAERMRNFGSRIFCETSEILRFFEEKKIR